MLMDLRCWFTGLVYGFQTRKPNPQPMAMKCQAATRNRFGYPQTIPANQTRCGFLHFVAVFCCFRKFLCWNVCWLAGFWMLALEAFFELGCYFQSQGMSFGKPCASIFALCGTIFSPWGHLGRFQEQQEGHMGSRIGFLAILKYFWDTILTAFRAPRAKHTVFFLGLFPCHFRHGFRVGTQTPVENLVFILKVLQKKILSQKSFL